MSVKSFLKGLAAGAVIGGAAGVVTGLMVSPKSGKALRRDLVEYVKDLSVDLDKLLRKAKVVTRDVYEQAVDEVMSTYHRIQEISEDDVKAIRARLMSEWEAFSKKVSKVTESK